jgi:hypothetical protein
LHKEITTQSEILGLKIELDVKEDLGKLDKEFRDYTEAKYAEITGQLQGLTQQQQRDAVGSIALKRSILAIQAQVKSIADGASSYTVELVGKIDSLSQISGNSDDIMEMLEKYRAEKLTASNTEDKIEDGLEEIRSIRDELRFKLKQSKSINLSVSSIDSQELLMDKLSGDHRGVIVRYLFTTPALMPIWGNVNSTDIKELKESTMMN